MRAAMQVALQHVTLRFHRERLADERAREQMRRRWQGALAELEALAAGEG